MPSRFYSSAAERIIQDYLRVSKKERLFILVDGGSGFAHRLSKSCLDEAGNSGVTAKVIRQRELSYGKPDVHTARLLGSLKRNDCLFVCMNGKLGDIHSVFGRGFRTLMRFKGVRFATMTGLMSIGGEEDQRSLLRAIIMSSSHVRETGKKLKELFDSGKELQVTGRAGTSLTMSIEGRKAWFNSGEFFRAGQGGNLPMGNVNVFPIESSVNGGAVLDISVKIEAETVVLKEPVELIIEDGEIVKIDGSGEVVEVIDRMYNDMNNFSFINAQQGLDPRGIFRIGEIGFGLLPFKPIGLTLMDEELLGICHIANGNNWGKGGRNRCRGHRDHLFWLDHIKIDGKRYTADQLGRL